LFERLQLKDVPYKTFDPSPVQLIEELWDALRVIDESVVPGLSSSAALNAKPKLKVFFDHCCTKRQYFFMIKKCGSSSCDTCKAPRVVANFQEIFVLPGMLFAPFSPSVNVTFYQAVYQKQNKGVCFK
jgi:hypothetical protein